MNRKILLTLSLALIAIAMASAASADENVTIDGINFNIPDGYTEDLDEAIVNETDTEDDMTIISNGKLYEKDDDIMTIVVATYEDGVNITDDVIDEMNGDDLKIKEFNGKLIDLGFLSVYSYEKDGKLVTLSTTVPDDLEKFII